jgi:hypothetical protein
MSESLERPRDERVITAPAPPHAVDPRSGRARHGTYRGTVGSADLGSLAPSLLARTFREKRWVYATFVRAPWMISIAIVDLGYAQTTFAFAFHEERGLVTDLPSMPGVPRLSRVRQDGVHRIDAALLGRGRAWRCASVAVSPRSRSTRACRAWSCAHRSISHRPRRR